MLKDKKNELAFWLLKKQNLRIVGEYPQIINFGQE